MTTTTTLAAFSITYDGTGSTGGSVPIDNQPYITGATVEVLWNPGNLIAIRGSTFEGWSTAPDGQGTTFISGEGQTFIMGSANVTLYAMWEPLYALGAHGEAGIVFYDRGSYTTGLTSDWRYMEYAPVDQTTQETWWDIATEVTLPIEGDIGTGKSNTAAIVALSGSSAAGTCQAYPGGAFTDWFLPSYEEFNRISYVSTTYATTEDKIASPAVYWTSTYWGWDGNNRARCNGDSFVEHWDWTDREHRVRAAREF